MCTPGPGLLLLFAAVGFAQDVRFPDNASECRLKSGQSGICLPIRSCPPVLSTFHVERPVSCGFVGNSPIVCCPRRTATRDDVKDIHVIAPNIDFNCGDSIPERVTVFSFADRSKRSLSSFLEAAAPDFEVGIAAVGGERARFVLTKYMALLGDRDSSGSIDWFCDGVLINKQWILTAAHCLEQRSVDVVRLGEHDYNDDFDGAQHQDFDVSETILFPEYRFPRAYHDLALIKLSTEIILNRYINPVCLPWEVEAKRNLLNNKITLTGWGATEHGGFGSSVLQEVNVTVFDHSRCDRSYSSLPQYTRQWPNGIGNETLCAGDPQGGKDACQGDSGGPVVYLDEERHYVLAGIVSKGYGCGLEEFPGLYVNMRQSQYLAWVKQVAFS